MRALAERTKIRTESSTISSSTTGLDFYSGYFEPYGYSGDQTIDIYAYSLASGSIQVQILRLFPELSLKAKEILYKLYRFQKLRPDWDGNGAVPPSGDIINKAANFLSIMDEYDLPVYFTAPGPNGEIVLEYKEDTLAAEVFFEDDSANEMILYNGKQQVYCGEVEKSRLIQHFTPRIAAYER